MSNSSDTLPSSEVQVKLFHDWHFMVLAKTHDSTVDFEVYELEHVFDRTDPAACRYIAPKFQDPDKRVPTFIHGFVKWDGCSNWTFDCSAGNGMMHACSRDELSRIGQVLELCYDWTAVLLGDRWDDCGDEQPLPPEQGEDLVRSDS